MLSLLLSSHYVRGKWLWKEVMRSYFGIPNVTTNKELSRKFLQYWRICMHLYFVNIGFYDTTSKHQKIVGYVRPPPTLCSESVLQETNTKLSLSKHWISRLDQSPLYFVPVCQSAALVCACLLFSSQLWSDNPFISYVNVPMILSSVIIKKTPCQTGCTTLGTLRTSRALIPPLNNFQCQSC